jgi:hypothetical protein
MIVDAIPYGANRPDIRAWHRAHGWCIRRMWPTTDEFERCDPSKGANQTFPPIFSMIRYDDAGWSISYAVFAPVPLAFDFAWWESRVNPDHEFVDPAEGLYVDLADRGRAIERPAAYPRPLAAALSELLAREIDKRCGAPTWTADQGWGKTWETKRTELGLFVTSNGHWIVETHEIKLRELLTMH